MKYFIYLSLYILVSCKEKLNATNNRDIDSVVVSIDSTFIPKTSKAKKKEAQEVRYVDATDSAASLSAVNDYRKNGEFIRSTSEGLFYIDSILTMDTISRKEFYLVKKDRSIIKQKEVYKKDSILYLPQLGTSNRFKFRDDISPTNMCVDEIYSYYGTIPFIERYVIGRFDCNEYLYYLIDQKTGKTKYQLVGYPFVSPQRKKVVSLATTPFYVASTFLQIDQVESDTLRPLYYFNFLYWIPFGEKLDVRWSNENTFFIKVMPSKYLGMLEAKNEKLAFYIRVEINE